MAKMTPATPMDPKVSRKRLSGLFVLSLVHDEKTTLIVMRAVVTSLKE